MKFLDEAKIHLKSGDGGPGAVSFRREKFIEYGGPDGGNGGKGGSVYFIARANLNTLIDFRYTQHFKAQNGQHGMGRNRSGADGKDLVIAVPVGTQLIDEDGETLIHDFLTDGEEFLFLKGGDGGFGNAHYKTSTNQAPRKFTPGWSGMERSVWLRLKLIADVGIIGLPNAGKSTFLSAVSAARPKIADYPFTTLAPNLGVVKIGDSSFVMADIPGLIAGASEGAGLGHKFLGHIERTAVLLHLIDATQDDVCAAYDIVRGELKAYDADLADRPEIVALNKGDALDETQLRDRHATLSAHIGPDTPVMAVSAVSGMGLRDVLFALVRTITDDGAGDLPS